MKFWITVMVGGVLSAPAFAQDPYLHGLYDRLNDSPLQQRLRREAPMPIGVVFLPWAGMTEADMRKHFRLMKELGFDNLKQTMPSPEWPQERIMEVALEEGIIPFWYGEAGWEEITPALLERLGIDAKLGAEAIRRHPKMVAHQKEVLRRGIALNSGHPMLEARQGAKFEFVPDPLLRPADVPFFLDWLKRNYKDVRTLSDAWNQREVGIDERLYQTWADVEQGITAMSQQANNLRGYGGEYGRVRDVLRFKADTHAAQVAENARAAREKNPYAPTRTGGEMGLFLPFAYRATRMESLAATQREAGSFYPSIHFAWHYGEVNYEVARPIYMQASFAVDLFKGGWTGGWESTGGPQQLTGAKGWNREQAETTPGFSVSAGTMKQLLLSFLAGGFKGAGLWTWNFRRAGWEGGEYALLDRNGQPGDRAVAAGEIAKAARKYREELWQAHKEPLVGVMYNWDNDAIWAAISLRGRDHFKHYPMEARVGVSRALINANVPWEHVTPADLKAGLGPRYKVIYLPGQLALNEELLGLLEQYVKEGGRVVIDSPGAAYDEHGKVFETVTGSAFEKLFGVELSDLQYSSNEPRQMNGWKANGFVWHVKPTKATVKQKFDTGEPAVVEHKVGKGSAVVLGWDASHAVFAPGQTTAERMLVEATLGGLKPVYQCEGGIAYRLAAPGAEHYFLINDGVATKMRLNPAMRGVARDAVTGEMLDLRQPVMVEGHSARWVRVARQ